MISLQQLPSGHLRLVGVFILAVAVLSGSGSFYVVRTGDESETVTVMTDTKTGAFERPLGNIALIGWDGAQHDHLEEMMAGSEVSHLVTLVKEKRPVDIDARRGATDARLEPVLNGVLLDDLAYAGIRWTPDKGFRVQSGGVPEIYRFPDGIFRLYYCKPGGGLFTARSTDGLSFTEETDTQIRGCDPSLVPLKMGGYRMYYKTQVSPDVHVVNSATSSDGVIWRDEGRRFEVMGPPCNGWTSVPDAIALPDGRVRLYFVCDKGVNEVRSAISSEGLNFALEDGIRLSRAVDPDVMPMPDDTYRMFYATAPGRAVVVPPTGIYTATSPDGLNWSAEGEVARVGDFEIGIAIADPSAILLSDGRIRVYFGLNTAQGWSVGSAVSIGNVTSPSLSDGTTKTYSVTNPTTNANLHVQVFSPKDAAGRRYLTLVLVPGGIGDSRALIDDATRMASAGFVAVVFDPDGRGRSTGQEDYDGHKQQDGLAAVIRFAATLPEVDANRIGIATYSYGITMGSGALARHVDLPGKFLIDWEGPADRNYTTGCRNDGGAKPIQWQPCTDNAWWSEREAVNFIGKTRVSYQRVQSEKDHVQPNNNHAIAMINAAIKGGLPFVRLNDYPANQMYDPKMPPHMFPEQMDRELAQTVIRYAQELDKIETTSTQTGTQGFTVRYSAQSTANTQAQSSPSIAGTQVIVIAIVVAASSVGWILLTRRKKSSALLAH